MTNIGRFFIVCTCVYSVYVYIDEYEQLSHVCLRVCVCVKEKEKERADLFDGNLISNILSQFVAPVKKCLPEISLLSQALFDSA